jgi:hypothetical protein
MNMLRARRGVSYLETWYFLKFWGRVLAIVWGAIVIGGWYFFYREKETAHVGAGCDIEVLDGGHQPHKRDARNLSNPINVQRDGWQIMTDSSTRGTVWVYKPDLDQKFQNPGCRPR